MDTGAGPNDDGAYKRRCSDKKATAKLEAKPLGPSPINFNTFQYIASMAMEGEFADDMIDDDDDNNDGVEDEEDEEEACE